MFSGNMALYGSELIDIIYANFVNKVFIKIIP